MQDVHITHVRCQGPNLSQTKRYYLTIVGKSSTLVGVAKTKSGQRTYKHDGITWDDPFGGRFSFVPSTIVTTLTFELSLRKSRRLVRDEVLGTCTIDDTNMSAASKDELAVPLRSNRGETLSAEAEAEAEGSTALPDSTMIPDVINRVDAWDSLRMSLTRLAGVVQLLDEIAKIHPWVQMAWGVVSVAYKVVQAQNDRDENVRVLVEAMARSCEFAQDAKGLKGSPRHAVIVQKILEQVVECAYFIRDYTRDASFVKRLRKHLVSWSIDEQIAQYTESFRALEAESTSDSVLQTHLIMDSIKKTIQEHFDYSILNGMQYTAEAQPDIDDVCLPGTRTEVIDAIMQWATGADGMLTDAVASSEGALEDLRPQSAIALRSDDTSRVLWTHRLGARYAFSANHAATKPSDLFATIARRLADSNHMLKKNLVDSIKDNTDLRETKSCIKQFKSFIIQPAAELPTVGETFILIDAFDESADIRDRGRKDVLDMLTREAHTLPPGVRFIVTSRKEPDVVQALQTPPEGVNVLFMDSIPTDLTSRDITLFIHNTLRPAAELHQDHIAALIAKAGLSFQWAFTACQFITDFYGGVIPGERLEELLETEDQNLDQLYAKILGMHFGSRSEKELKRLRLVLGFIVSAQEPLALKVLKALITNPPNASVYSTPEAMLDSTLPFLSSLLSGTHREDVGISPLHPSFREFICTPERSNPFTIITETSHLLMVHGCLRIMRQELRFNICQLPTSSKANRDIEGLDALVRQYVSSPLSYACRYWMYHASCVAVWSDELVQEVDAFFKTRLLWWLEVMSVVRASFQDALDLLGNAEMHPSSLVPVIQDSRRFASTFGSPILQSAPHIYLSALAFTPTSSFTYRRYRMAYPNIAAVIQGRLETWPNLIRMLESPTSFFWRMIPLQDGKRMATIHGDNQAVCTWDVRTGEVINEFHVPYSPIDVSSDGTLVLYRTFDGDLNLWDTKPEGVQHGPFRPTLGRPNSARISPDGTRIVACTWMDYGIMLWNAQTGEVILEHCLRSGYFSDYMEEISAPITFSRDSAQFISGSAKGYLCIHNARDGRRIVKPWRGHTSCIAETCYSPRGQHLLSGSYDGTVRLWDVITGEGVGRPFDCHQSVRCVAFSPDGTTIAVGCQGANLYLWNAATGDLLSRWATGHTLLPQGELNPEGDIQAIAFLLAGTQLISHAFRGDSLCLWDVALSCSERVPRTTAHSAATTCVAFSPDGEYILSGSRDQTLCLWDTNTGERVGSPFKTAAETSELLSAAFSPDGSSVISIFREACVAWDVGTGEVLGEPVMLGVPGHYTLLILGYSSWVVALTPDKTQIAQVTKVDEKLKVQVSEVNAGADRKTVQLPLPDGYQQVSQICFSPDQKYLLVAFNTDRGPEELFLCNAETGEQVGDPWTWTGGVRGTVSEIYFSPDGSRVMLLSSCAYEDKRVFVDDDGKVVPSPVRHLGTVIMFDVETAREIGRPFLDRRVRQFGSGVSAAAFSPDSKRIVCILEDFALISLWDLESAQEIGTVETKHDSHITSVAFSPNGLQVATGSNDATVRLMDVGHLLERPRPDLPSTPEASTSLLPHPPRANEQYPEALFPDGTFYLHDGWILGPEDELVLWVPPVHQRGLRYPFSRAIGASHPTELDFSKYVGGKDWAKCYSPETGSSEAPSDV